MSQLRHVKVLELLFSKLTKIWIVIEQVKPGNYDNFFINYDNFS